MLSRQSKERSKTLIPYLLSQHDAVLSGNQETVDLSTAENWLIKDKILEGLPKALESFDNSDLSYAQGIGGCSKTRERLSAFINEHFNPFSKVDSSEIVLAAGGSFALTALAQQICDPGDGILIAAPYWAGLDISLSVHHDAKVVPVHIPLDEFFDVTGVKYYEAALKSSPVPVKAVLVCNPHNPLGRCYPRETLQAMVDFCSRNSLHYISDEVYALSLHRPVEHDYVPFTSALSLDGGKGLVHVIYSLSKDFGCSGLRLGAFITQGNETVRLSGALNTHSQTSTMATSMALRHFLRDDIVTHIQTEGAEKLTTAYHKIRDFLAARRIPFSQAPYGLFVFARLCLSDSVESEKLLNQCIKKAGVAVSTGTSYHFNQAGWFRICYAVPPEQLEEGLRRIDKGMTMFHDLISQADSTLSA
ncbi:aminotransferase GliI [Xylona heveae TC161]|uniref:Aminotransferase GliI n=1 Tax=Xylona heveae (strain CBS 132557 / TC161) TaxID=1328760 RepID=A0A165HU08_XYLHT|nr:aminotransferase GliI [Xylona heveae TC161]KZF23925.1 aminotransferase GliI [Xylona heveae TC161]